MNTISQKPKILKKNSAKKHPEFGFCFRGHGGKSLKRKKSLTEKILKKVNK